MLTLIFFLPFLYNVYWYFGPIQVKQIHAENNNEIYRKYFDNRNSYKISYINNKETVVAINLGYIGSIEKYYIKNTKDRVKLYIVMEHRPEWNPFDDNYPQNHTYYRKLYKINKKIDANNIEVYTKGLEDKDFKQIKLFNM